MRPCRRGAAWSDPRTSEASECHEVCAQEREDNQGKEGYDQTNKMPRSAYNVFGKMAWYHAKAVWVVDQSSIIAE